jgi:hypothetical protein
MEGATLECLEVLRVLRDALPLIDGDDSQPTRLPLLRHLIAVALEGANVDMPFASFFES